MSKVGQTTQKQDGDISLRHPYPLIEVLEAFYVILVYVYFHLVILFNVPE